MDTRTTLTNRLDEVLGRDARIAARLRRTGETREQATLLADAEVLASLDESARAEVDAIRAALARMDAGTWGTCARCGGAIGDARLAALPTTPVCVDCAEEDDRR